MTRIAGVLLALLIVPAPASADWLFTPFAGYTFGRSTNYVDLASDESSRKVVVGGSVALLSDGFLGVEADFGYSRGFFDESQRRGALVTGSNVTTLTGNLVLAAPLAVTRESLRPYVTGGVGLLHASVNDVLGIAQLDRNLLGLSVGVGAIGLINHEFGFRFDLRRFQNLSREGSNLVNNQEARLSFWRGTIGVTLRY